MLCYPWLQREISHVSFGRRRRRKRRRTPTCLFLPAGYRLNDGYWHTVDLAAKDNLLSVTIDEDEGSPLKITNPFMVRTGDRYFFGGE